MSDYQKQNPNYYTQKPKVYSGWESAYNDAVTNYTHGRLLRTHQLLNYIRKTYPGQYNEKKVSRLEKKLKGRL